MLDWAVLSQLQLDIVGIVAVLGEGSTSRNAQASALGWHHVLPRLIPAPQALLRHERARRLPTVPGTVVGAYSGNVKFELNFFCQLLHDDKLPKNQVELVEVRRKKDNDCGSFEQRAKPQQPGHARTDEGGRETSRTKRQKASRANRSAYGVKPFCPLVVLSVLGCCAALFMLVLSVVKEDGFALLATLMLSLNSSLVGFASWWRLDIREDIPKTAPQQNRTHAIPDSDVVIYYPRQGAFRIVRCEESVSRLYFKTEICEHTLGDNAYRALALAASIFLMIGLLCMGNAKNVLKLAFAAIYMLLNALWWSFSAFSPVGDWGHWQHEYDLKVIKVLGPPKEALAHFVKIGSVTDTPVLGRRSLDLAEDNTRITNSPLSMSPTEHIFPSKKGDLLKTLEFRKRRVGVNQHSQSSSEPAIELKSMQAANPISAGSERPQITISPIHLPSSDKAQTRRQNTHDLEGQRVRLLKPFGSAWLAVEKWLDRRRLINRPLSRTPTADLDGSERPDTFTDALWKAIAVTGSTRWLHQTHIAPDNAVWSAWIDEAQRRAETFDNVRGERVAAFTMDDSGNVILPSWNYQGRLGALFEKEKDLRKRRPPAASRLAAVTMEVRLMGKLSKVKGITPSIEFKLRRVARAAQLAVRQRNVQRANTTPGIGLTRNGNGTILTDTVIRDFARRRSHA